MKFLSTISTSLAILMSGAALASKSVTIPFDISSRGHILVPVTINDHKPLHFVFDTGAGMTVLNQSSFSDSLMTGKQSEPVAVYRVHGNHSARTVTLASFQLGAFRQTNVSALIMDMSDAEADEVKTDGIVGHNFFGHYDITIDYAEKSLTLAQPDSIAQCSELPGVDFVLNNGTHVQFPLLLGDVQIQAILDTGSPVTGINGEAANAILPNAVERLKRARRAHSDVAGPANQMSGHGNMDLFIGQLGIGRIGVADHLLAENHPTNVVNLPVFRAFRLDTRPSAIVGGDLLSNKKVRISYTCSKLEIS